MSILSIGRATLPQEFFDVTTRQLLIQPEPQYAHARLLLSALSMELDMMGANPLNLTGRSMPQQGGSYIGLEQMQFEIDDAYYTAAFKIDTTFLSSPGGSPVGHTIRMNRPRFTDTTYTQASREVAAGTVISTTPVAVASDQVSLTLKRYAGPYDSTAGAVAPLAIERFDAARSVHSIPAVRELHLTRDFHKAVDTWGVQLFNSVDPANVVFPDGMTANNDSITAGDFPFSFGQLLKAQRTLDDLYVPLFANGKRMAILTTLQAEQLARDAEYRQLAVYTPPKNPLLVGAYVGTVGQIEVFKSSTLSRVANSNSVNVHYGQMFGPGMIGAAPGEMPRTATNAQDNYGENPLVVWFWYLALGVLDSRFGVVMRST